MRLPPAIVDIKRMAHGKRKLRLWLPVFLLWPVGLAILIFLSPILLALALIYPFMGTIRIFFERLGAVVVFGCSLRGLTVSIEQKTKAIQIHIM